MYKLLLSLLVGSSLSFAAMVNGIALTVNDEPITIYDIEKTMEVNKVGKNEAVGYLIDKILYDRLVQDNGISADVFEINEYVEKLASSNGMDVYTFKSMVKQKYPDYSIFEEETKNSIIRQKLVQKIVKGQLAVATQEDMELYYEKNKSNFLTAKSYDVVQYAAKDRATLIEMMKNPMMVSSEIQKTNLTLETQNLPAQMQYLLNETKESSFTPILTSNKQFVTLFLVRKNGTAALGFESVKAKIFNDIMTSREKKYLKDYFEKQKLTADIKIVR